MPELPIPPRVALNEGMVDTVAFFREQVAAEAAGAR